MKQNVSIFKHWVHFKDPTCDSILLLSGHHLVEMLFHFCFPLLTSTYIHLYLVNFCSISYQSHCTILLVYSGPVCSKSAPITPTTLL